MRKRRKTKTVVIPPKPWVEAESSLFNLEGRLPLAADIVFVELTDIVRCYIESVYEIPASEQTTPEFLNEINRSESKLSTDQRLLLVDFLTAADMVKFAKLEANQEQIEEAIGKAKRFVIETSEPIIQAESVKSHPRGSNQDQA